MVNINMDDMTIDTGGQVTQPGMDQNSIQGIRNTQSLLLSLFTVQGRRILTAFYLNYFTLSCITWTKLNLKELCKI